MKTRLIQIHELQQLVERVGLNSFVDFFIDDITEKICSLDVSQITVPERMGFAYRRPDLGLVEWMPSMIHGRGAFLKMVCYHPSNPRLRQLPTILSSASVFDTESGHLVGIMDATFTTALRTGVMSAIATRILGSPSSSTLGIIGCGAQSVTQAHAISRVFKLRKIIGFDTDPLASASFGKRLEFLGIEVETVAHDSVELLIQNSDILCTCTSNEPGSGAVFSTLKVPDHLHINAVGSDYAGKFEIPVELLRRATVFPDFRAQAIREGECQQLTAEEIGPDVLQLIKKSKEFHCLRKKLTVFDSTGWGLIDHLVAMEILELASEYRLGTEIQLECVHQDSLNPYAFLDTSLLTTAMNAQA